MSGGKKNSPRRLRAATSGPSLRDGDDQTRRREIEEQFGQAQLDRDQQAYDAVRKDDMPGGAAEALRFLAERAAKKQIWSSGGPDAVRKALSAVEDGGAKYARAVSVKMMLSAGDLKGFGPTVSAYANRLENDPFEFWRHHWIKRYQRDILRLVRQAGEAPRSVAEIRKQFSSGPSDKFGARRVMQMAVTLFKAVAIIRDLDAEGHWSKVAIPRLPETLEVYANTLQRVAEDLLNLDRSPQFKDLLHQNDEWLLERIRSLTGRAYREKVTAIMRKVYPLAGHFPVEANSLSRWQRRHRQR